MSTVGKNVVQSYFVDKLTGKPVVEGLIQSVDPLSLDLRSTFLLSVTHTHHNSLFVFPLSVACETGFERSVRYN